MAAKRSRGVVIADTLREQIINGELEPGKHLTEAEVASLYETSRTPVREAFRQLESEGLVRLRPHRGALITSITPEDIRNYYELHGLLASYAAEKAATRMPTVGIDKMESLAKDLRKFSEQKNFSAMVETHNALFEHFISVCENERLSSTICNLMRPFQRFRVMLSESESNLGAVEFYEEIIAAFRERDPQRAAFLAAKYSGDTSVSILRNITHGHTPNREE